MKRRSGATNQDAKPNVDDSYTSVTIAQFEHGKSAPQRRASFKSLISDLQISPEASIIISTNPFLELFNTHELLFFSTEYRESTLRTLQHKPGSAASKRELSNKNNLNTVVLNSLNAFNDDYKACSSLAQSFLITSTQMLTKSSEHHKAGELDASFEGFSIESIPSYDSKSAQRSDCYHYDSQQIKMCFQPLHIPLNASCTPSVLLAHELTHAIDDTYTKLNSCKLVFDNLHKNAPQNTMNQNLILECAAAIIDEQEMLQYSYLPQMTTWLSLKDHEVDPATYYSKEDIVDGRCFQTKNGNLRLPSEFTEFLTFSIEHVFNSLNESTTPQEFENKYRRKIESSVSVNARDYLPNIKKAAFELIKDTTTTHLKLLQKHSTYHELQECCDKAINVLETQYSSLHTPSLAIARSSSTPEVKDVAPSLKRGSSPLDPKDVQSEKKLDIINTKPLASHHILPPSDSSSRKNHPSIQNNFYSKDDSGIENIVEQMCERFMNSKKIPSNTQIAKSNRNIGPRPHSR